MSGDDNGQDHDAGPARAPLSPEAAWRRAVPIYYALLAAILTVVGIYLLLALRHVLVILFISLLFAAAVARPASVLEQWRVPRGLAAVGVYIVSLAVLAGIGWFVLPPVFNQVAEFTDQIPHYVDRYQRLEQTYDELRQQYPGLESFESQVSGVGARILGAVGQRLAKVPSDLFSLFLDVLSVFVVSLLLVTTRGPLLRFILSLVRPEHRDKTERILGQMWTRVGAYLRAKVIVMLIVAAITYVALLLIGVPYALLLAIIVGLGELIPRIGPWLARIPLLLIAGLEGWVVLGITFAASVVIENLKGSVISPFVEGDQLNVPPLLTFVAILAGAELLGVAGAFIAVPAMAMIQVVFEEVIIPWRRAQVGDPEPTPRKPEPSSAKRWLPRVLSRE